MTSTKASADVSVVAGDVVLGGGAVRDGLSVDVIQIGFRRRGNQALC